MQVRGDLLSCVPYANFQTVYLPASSHPSKKYPGPVSIN